MVGSEDSDLLHFIHLAARYRPHELSSEFPFRSMMQGISVDFGWVLVSNRLCILAAPNRGILGIVEAFGLSQRCFFNVVFEKEELTFIKNRGPVG